MRKDSQVINLLIAGFGGQGIMFLAKTIGQAAVIENKNVTAIPSYGAEMRGGTAYCLIKISESEIFSPIFSKADVAVIMNKPSLDKFKDKLDSGCIAVINRLAADKGHPTSPRLRRASKSEKSFYFYSFTGLASSLGNVKVANIIALGALIKRSSIVEKKSIIIVLEKNCKGEKDIFELNMKALELGWKTN